jgi:hypothetical protein
MNDLHDEFVNISKFEKQLIKVQSDETLHYNFSKNTESLSAFWLMWRKEKPILGKEAL